MSIGVNIVLTLLNLAIAAASGSLAVAAEKVHNLVDLVASVAVLAGVKISERAYVFGDAGVETRLSGATTLAQTLAEQMDQGGNRAEEDIG